MNYIIVLNWNSAKETITCIQSLIHLENYDQVRIIVCDNDSRKESYDEIYNFLNTSFGNDFFALTEEQAENYALIHKLYFIKNKENYGYAGGNNRGIKFSLKFSDMQNVWVLNNDTIVQPDSLNLMIKKINIDKNYGVIGSRLVELENKQKVQGVGGVINKWFCTTKEIGSQFKINDEIDEKEFENKIDYVIGASLLINRKCLEKVGLLCEDYFLYYEEIDYCNRAKAKDFKVGIASKSIIFHEHGASTGKGKSDVADYCSVKNRILISKKFYKRYTLICRISILGVVLIRVFRFQFLIAIWFIYFFCS